MSNITRYNLNSLNSIAKKFEGQNQIQSLNETSISTPTPRPENLLWGTSIETRNGFEVILKNTVIHNSAQPQLYQTYSLVTKNGEEYEFKVVHFEERNNQYYAVICFESEYDVPLKEIFKYRTNFWVGRDQWTFIEVPNQYAKSPQNESLGMVNVSNIPKEIGLMIENAPIMDILDPANSPVKKIFDQYFAKLESNQQKIAKLTTGDIEEISGFIERLANDPDPLGEAIKMYEKLKPLLENLQDPITSRMESGMYALYNQFHSLKEQLDQKKLK